VHDRPWQDRSVYGKVRYMNANGARRKFDVDAYVRRVAPDLLDAQLF
jgi:deoxyribodipyrimidine photo-lyase